MELNNDMLFYCRKCDTAPIEVEKDKDGFYICTDCKDFASVVEKDEQEKETLSDKIITIDHSNYTCVYDTRKHLKELIDWIPDSFRVQAKAMVRKRFGERFIE